MVNFHVMWYSSPSSRASHAGNETRSSDVNGMGSATNERLGCKPFATIAIIENIAYYKTDGPHKQGNLLEYQHTYQPSTNNELSM